MHDKCPVYLDARFKESPSKNQKSSKVNMKSTICHDFTSPDLLEGPKDRKIKESFFHSKVFKRRVNRKKLQINIFNITRIGDLVWAGESDHTPFIDRTEYHNLS